MLIEFLFEKFSNWEDVNEAAIGDLQVYETIKAVDCCWIFPYYITNLMLHFGQCVLAHMASPLIRTRWSVRLWVQDPLDVFIITNIRIIYSIRR